MSNKDLSENIEFFGLQSSKKMKKFDISSISNYTNAKMTKNEENSSQMILLDPLNIQGMKNDKNRKKSSYNISLSSSIMTSVNQRKSYQNVI